MKPVHYKNFWMTSGVIVFSWLLSMVQCYSITEKDKSPHAAENAIAEVTFNNLFLVEKYAENPQVLSGVFHTLIIDEALFKLTPRQSSEQMVEFGKQRLKARDQAVANLLGKEGFRFFKEHEFLDDLILNGIDDSIAPKKLDRPKMVDMYFNALSKAKAKTAIDFGQGSEWMADSRLITLLLKNLDAEFSAGLANESIAGMDDAAHKVFRQLITIATTRGDLIDDLLKQMRIAYINGMKAKIEAK